MLLQISLLNQLAQVQLDRIAIGGQESYCIGNSDPVTFPGDCQHLFLQKKKGVACPFLVPIKSVCNVFQIK